MALLMTLLDSPGGLASMHLLPFEVGDVGEVEGVQMLSEVVCHVLHARAHKDR